jgi:hypothetical protein
MHRSLVLGLFGVLFVMTGCPKTSGGGDGGNGDGGNGDGGNGDASANVDGSTADGTFVIPDGGVVTFPDGGTCIIRTCQGKVYQCGDCIDNDNDGRTDDQDRECLGSCQNNESGFSGDIPGQNNAPCRSDCYFDQDTGPGNDSCEWDHRCDPHEVAPDFYPEQGCNYNPDYSFGGGVTCQTRQQSQPAVCATVCGPLTPNGCDCFGCCTIPPSTSTTEGVFLNSKNSAGVPTCDLASAADPTKCHPCQIVQSCFKTCGRCQLCVGKPDVPADCYETPDGGGGTSDGGVPLQCPGGEQPCGLPGQPVCPSRFFCVTGCCQPIIP